MSERYLDYIISNYNRYASDTNRTMSNFIELQSRFERNLSRIIRSEQERRRMETTERVFAEYNISMENLRNESERIRRTNVNQRRDERNVRSRSQEGSQRNPAFRNNFNRIDEVLNSYRRTRQNIYQNNSELRNNSESSDNDDGNEINNSELTANNPQINNTETNVTETNVTETNDTETNVTETNDTETNDTETNDTETNDTETNDTETNDIYNFLREQRQRLRRRRNTSSQIYGGREINNNSQNYETEYSRNYNRNLNSTVNHSMNAYNRNRDTYHIQGYNIQRPTRYHYRRPSGLSDLLNLDNNTSIENTINTVLASLSPVPVRPTPNDIALATEVIAYNQVTDDQQTRCPIDLQSFEPEENVIRIIHCGHIFRENNLIRWFSNNVRCPLCRYDIREYNPLRHIRNPYQSLSNEDNSQENSTSHSVDEDEEPELDNTSLHMPILSQNFVNSDSSENTEVTTVPNTESRTEILPDIHEEPQMDEESEQKEASDEESEQDYNDESEQKEASDEESE